MYEITRFFIADKLSRWNVVGIQGALLAHYIEPIYLYSVTLGSLFHPSHMFRAMVGRIQVFFSFSKFFDIDKLSVILY